MASPPLVLRYPDAALVARLVEQGAVHARTALETLSVAGRYARESLLPHWWRCWRSREMTKPTTIRLPEDVLSELDRRALARGKDRATLLRELLRAALDRDKEDEVIAAYRAGVLSLSQAAERFGTDVWSLFDILSLRGEPVSASL